MKIQQGCTSAIILNEKDEILFTKRSDSDDFLPGVWELPGGGIEYGETPQDSIKREIKEECGLEIEVQSSFPHVKWELALRQNYYFCYNCSLFK